MFRPTRPLTAAALVLVIGLLGACGSGDGGSKTPAGAVLDRDALAKDLSTRLSDATGDTPPKVTCPGDLPVKKDLTVRCTADIGSKTYGLTVTVTGTDGGAAQYDVAVDKTPQQ